MKIQQILPVKKSPSRRCGESYIRIGLKAFYISAAAMAKLGDTDYVALSIDTDNRMVIVSKAEQEDPGAFKLSRVCETMAARRIETNRSLLSIVRGGFPLYMIDRHLPAYVGLDGSLMANFSLPIPLRDPPQEANA